MDEIWLIEGRIVYQGPRCPFAGSKSLPQTGLAYAFYNQKTGHVWGKRMCLHLCTSWIYVPANFPDILLPYEVLQNFLPDSYFEYLVEYFASAQDLTVPPEAGILHPNFSNHPAGTPQ